MAKQSSIIKLEGTIGGISFYKSQDGYLAREKGGVPADRIATDPAFQRTRENGAEFGAAGVGGKLLRAALRPLMINAKDSRVTSRLTKAMVKVVQGDTTNRRGERTVTAGDFSFLEGFEFNENGKLGATLYAPFTTTITRGSGELEVVVPAFVPSNLIAAPSGATHFKIVSGGVEVNFTDLTFVQDMQSSASLPLTNTPTSLTTLTNTVTPNSTSPLFLVLGIEFYQEVNGVQYPLKNGAYNTLSIVDMLA
jgi:hypothetical protein